MPRIDLAVPFAEKDEAKRLSARWDGERKLWFEMYCEPQGAFFPMDERAASLIVLHEFAEPFGCNGGTSYGDHLFEYMRRA